MAIKTKVKQLFFKITGKFSHLKKGIIRKHQWYGNTYGGFYVCPEFLNEHSIVYSFGIGEDISFDSALSKQHNCQIFGFDPTPKSINWVAQQQLPPKFHFYGFGISNKSEWVDFYLPKNADFVSGSKVVHKHINQEGKVAVQMKSIQDIMHELGHTHIDVLKMDIEGSEYDVIDNILDSNVSITQILIEFHDRFFENGTNKTKDAIQKLKEHGYEIFGVSDSFEEISLIQKSAL